LPDAYYDAYIIRMSGLEDCFFFVLYPKTLIIKGIYYNSKLPHFSVSIYRGLFVPIQAALAKTTPPSCPSASRNSTTLTSSCKPANYSSPRCPTCTAATRGESPSTTKTSWSATSPSPPTSTSPTTTTTTPTATRRRSNSPTPSSSSSNSTSPPPAASSQKWSSSTAGSQRSGRPSPPTSSTSRAQTASCAT